MQQEISVGMDGCSTTVQLETPIKVYGNREYCIDIRLIRNDYDLCTNTYFDSECTTYALNRNLSLYLDDIRYEQESDGFDFVGGLIFSYEFKELCCD